MITPERIKESAANLLPQAIKARRHLHQNPELSFHEKETAAFIAESLLEAGIRVENGIGGHGVVGLIEGTASGPSTPERKTVALRADIDALPITEGNEVDYKSKNAGVMHACGHDAHTASLLTAAQVLKDMQEELTGTVKLLFQPAEERAPGGASAMIKDGVLEAPHVDTVLGQHVNPEVPAGKVGFRSGLFMGSVDDVYITVHGRGGHAAKPQLCVDPVAIASSLITTLQHVVSRHADPTLPTVLSFGYMNAPGSNNIIPDFVEIAGTMRTFEPEWRDDCVAAIRKITVEHVASLGGRADITITRGYPSLANDPVLTSRARGAAEHYLGAENVVDLPPALWAEDFAYYAFERPSCFYNLGVRNEERGIVHPVHSPSFDLDESALEIGAGLMAWIAIKEIQ